MQAENASEDQIADVLGRAKEYYLQRKWVVSRKLTLMFRAHEQLTTDGAYEPLRSNTEAQTVGGDTASSEPYPTSFSAIVELIASGNVDKIPGVREIPLKINDQAPTESKMTRPAKPWEQPSA